MLLQLPDIGPEQRQLIFVLAGAFSKELDGFPEALEFRDLPGGRRGKLLRE